MKAQKVSLFCLITCADLLWHFCVKGTNGLKTIQQKCLFQHKGASIFFSLICHTCAYGKRSISNEGMQLASLITRACKGLHVTVQNKRYMLHNNLNINPCAKNKRLQSCCLVSVLIVHKYKVFDFIEGNMINV